MSFGNPQIVYAPGTDVIPTPYGPSPSTGKMDPALLPDQVGIDFRTLGAKCDALRLNDIITTANGPNKLIITSNNNWQWLPGGGFNVLRDTGKIGFLEAGLWGPLPGSANVSNPYANYYGNWSNGHNYKFMDVVVGSDGNAYAAIQANLGQDPTLDVTHTYWTYQGVAANGQVCVPMRVTITAVLAPWAVQIDHAPLNSWAVTDSVNLTWGTLDDQAWQTIPTVIDPLKGVCIIIPDGLASLVTTTLPLPRDVGTDQLTRYRPLMLRGSGRRRGTVYGIVPFNPLIQIAADDGTHKGCSLYLQDIMLSNKADKGTILNFLSTAFLADRLYLTTDNYAFEFEGDRSTGVVTFAHDITAGQYMTLHKTQQMGGNPLGNAFVSSANGKMPGFGFRFCECSEVTLDDYAGLGGNAGRLFIFEAGGAITLRHTRLDSGGRSGLQGTQGRSGTVNTTANSAVIVWASGFGGGFTAADAPQLHGQFTRIWLDLPTGPFRSFIKSVAGNNVTLDDPVPSTNAGIKASTMNQLAASIVFTTDQIVSPGTPCTAIYIERQGFEGDNDDPTMFFDTVNRMTLDACDMGGGNQAMSDGIIFRACTDVIVKGGGIYDQTRVQQAAQVAYDQAISNTTTFLDVNNASTGTPSGDTLPASGIIQVPVGSGGLVALLTYNGKSVGGGTGGSDRLTVTAFSGTANTAVARTWVTISGNMPTNREPYVAPVGQGLFIDSACARMRFEEFKTYVGNGNVTIRGTGATVFVEALDASPLPNGGTKSPSTQKLTFGTAW